MAKPCNWYTVYSAKTDEIVASGTFDMIVRQMGCASKKQFFLGCLPCQIQKEQPPAALHLPCGEDPAGGHKRKGRYSMKIIIKDANGQIAVNIEAENETGVSKSQVWATMSLALASMVAEDARKKDMPPALKKLMVDTTAEMVAAAVKDDFLKVANSGTHGVSFYNKEAEFMRKVFDL